MMSPVVVVVVESDVTPVSGASLNVWQYGLHGLSTHVVLLPPTVLVPSPGSADFGAGAAALKVAPLERQVLYDLSAWQLCVPRAQSTVSPLRPISMPQSRTWPGSHGCPSTGGLKPFPFTPSPRSRPLQATAAAIANANVAM
jgi:hypothetical protein